MVSPCCVQSGKETQDFLTCVFFLLVKTKPQALKFAWETDQEVLDVSLRLLRVSTSGQEASCFHLHPLLCPVVGCLVQTHHVCRVHDTTCAALLVACLCWLLCWGPRRAQLQCAHLFPFPLSVSFLARAGSCNLTLAACLCFFMCWSSCRCITNSTTEQKWRELSRSSAMPQAVMPLSTWVACFPPASSRPSRVWVYIL